MAISNEQAMQELNEMKRAALSFSPCHAYDIGLLIGAAGAYHLADIITLEQYMQITEPAKVQA